LEIYKGEVLVVGSQQRLHLLERVARLRRDPQLVTLDRGRYLELRGLDLLDHGLCLVGGDAVDERDVEAVVAARSRLGFVVVERLQADLALDQLGLEHVERRHDALFGVRADGDAVARPLHRRAGVLEVVALRDLLGGLVDRVVDLLPVDLGHDVETVVGHGGCSS
jgi:hypothetical protein